MRSWKLAFAYLLFSYLFLAGAISLAVQHYSQAALTRAGLDQTSNTDKTGTFGSRQMAVQQRNDPIPTPPPALANHQPGGHGESTGDVSQASDIPSSRPSPIDDYGQIMTRALER